MPQRASCGKCGEILYEGGDLTPPNEIIQAYDGKCPKCGKKLSFYGNVKIRPVGEKSKPVPLPGTKKSGYKEEVKVPLTKELTTKTSEYLQENFLETFKNGINALIEKFGLFDISQEITKVGGYRWVRENVIQGIFVSLDAETYQGAEHALKVDLITKSCAYYERDAFSLWGEVKPKDVPLGTRKKYRDKVIKKLEILAELLEKDED